VKLGANKQIILSLVSIDLSSDHFM